MFSVIYCSKTPFKAIHVIYVTTNTYFTQDAILMELLSGIWQNTKSLPRENNNIIKGMQYRKHYSYCVIEMLTSQNI